MSEILSIGSVWPTYTSARPSTGFTVHRTQPDPDTQGGVAAPRLPDNLRQITEQSSLRQARVRAVRAEIGNGTYETPERINGTVDRLLDVIA